MAQYFHNEAATESCNAEKFRADLIHYLLNTDGRSLTMDDYNAIRRASIMKD